MNPRISFALQQKATALLENPLTYPGLEEHSRRASVVLRVWRYPSFEAHCSWAVITSRGIYFLRRVIWDHSAQEQTELVTFADEVPLDRQVYSDLLNDLQAITLRPFLANNVSTGDGTHYGVETLVFTTWARMNWWVTPPPDWAPLQAWHQRAVKAFEALLPARAMASADNDKNG